tara:strand:- start:76 stop:189 length:114 start_codon:yes stop_codon:yes gene_type:complete
MESIEVPFGATGLDDAVNAFLKLVATLFHISIFLKIE